MPDEVPDYYADQFTIAVTPYGVSLVFMKTPSSPTLTQQTPSAPVAVVRMSLEHAKIMTMLIRKQLKQMELETIGDPINLPRTLLAQMNLNLEEW